MASRMAGRRLLPRGAFRLSARFSITPVCVVCGGRGLRAAASIFYIVACNMAVWTFRFSLVALTSSRCRWRRARAR